jgi:glutamate formiminotransferase/glutamate formiminotransferase/formiminotetrahydrofolate cyclodeaminase
MDRLVECVPNFSEGRNRATVGALIEAMASVPAVWVLDHTMDGDHHRAVLTSVGEPEAMLEAAFRAIRVATDLIDLRHHRGVHPRIGATDVVPFVPVKGMTMQECVHLARRLGQRVGEELEIPVFLYERAASRRDHAPLEAIRRGGLDGLAFRMASDPDWAPDFGPPRLHQTAGAIVIGTRPPLIAFNVNLRSTDLDLARSVAKAVRQSNGGLAHLKAIGVELASRRMVQVAMNLTDYHVTPVHAAFEAIKVQVALRGVSVAGSEIIGLVPQAALDMAAIHALELEGFDRSQVLEARIEAALSQAHAQFPGGTVPKPEDLRRHSLLQLLDAVAAPTRSPAGGSVAAVVGALSAALGVMGARLGRQRAVEHRLLDVVRRLTDLAEADVAAYRRFVRATEHPLTDPHRPAALASALHVATEVPLEIAEQAIEAGMLLRTCVGQVRSRARSDLRVGMLLAAAAAGAGLHTVGENLKIQPNQRFKVAVHRRAQQAWIRLEELEGLCYTPPPGRSGTGIQVAQAQPGKARKPKVWKSKSSITTSRKRSRSPKRSSRGKGFSGN